MFGTVKILAFTRTRTDNIGAHLGDHYGDVVLMRSLGVRIRDSSRERILNKQNGVLHIVRHRTFNFYEGATEGRMFVGFSGAFQTHDKPHVFGQTRPFAGPSGAAVVAWRQSRLLL